MTRRWQHRALFLLLLLAAAAAVMFGLRMYHSYQLLRTLRAPGAHEAGRVRAWMTLRHIAAAHKVDQSELLERLGLPADTDPNMSLRTLARRQDRSVPEFVEAARRTIIAVRRATPSPGEGGP